MATTTQNTSRTTHLLALLKKGDDAFNSRDFAGTPPRHDCAHHRERRADPRTACARRGDEGDDPHLSRRPHLQRPITQSSSEAATGSP
jgi:hypothetical protein